MGAESALEFILPVAFVFLGAGFSVHIDLTVYVVDSPLTLIVVTTGKGHGSIAPFHSSLTLPFLD